MHFLQKKKKGKREESIKKKGTNGTNIFALVSKEFIHQKM